MKTIQQILYLICLFLVVNVVYPQYPNRQVTGNPYDQSETAIAVNPTNRSQIVIGWNAIDASDDSRKVGRMTCPPLADLSPNVVGFCKT
ncbi:MAG: hypothetical protein HY800_00790 [Ignavibacteriales bacterium]|nr:hypothetical protein [Ignavibacteriales bacterium]